MADILKRTSIHLETNNAICAHVMVAPLDKSTTVFNNGTTIGSIGIIWGGQPNSILKAEWKKAQKKEKKKHTSLTMNNNMPDT